MTCQLWHRYVFSCLNHIFTHATTTIIFIDTLSRHSRIIYSNMCSMAENYQDKDKDTQKSRSAVRKFGFSSNFLPPLIFTPMKFQVFDGDGLEPLFHSGWNRLMTELGVFMSFCWSLLSNHTTTHTYSQHFQTIETSRIVDLNAMKKKPRKNVEKIPDLNNIELNTPKPLYGPMAELGTVYKKPIEFSEWINRRLVYY